MAFHVEISVPMRHARVFNLNREDLLAKVVGPWLEDRPIEMGDREWEPRESSLKILEGPEMEAPTSPSARAGRTPSAAPEDVTRELLAEAPAPSVPDAFVVETDSPEAVTRRPGRRARRPGDPLERGAEEARRPRPGDRGRHPRQRGAGAGLSPSPQS